VCALDKNGQVWGWGYNYFGNLGINSIINKSTPTSILGNKKTFCNIINSRYYSIAVDYKNVTWGWGNNNVSQLGFVIDSTTPLRVCNF
jgi:alpha-tubulin suppressor-like RCC1 family protein